MPEITTAGPFPAELDERTEDGTIRPPAAAVASALERTTSANAELTAALHRGAPRGVPFTALARRSS